MSQPISLKLYLDHLRHAVAIADPAGKLVYGNAVFKAYFHCDPQLISLTVDQLFAPEPIIVQAFHKVVNLRGTYSLRSIPVQVYQKENREMDIDTFPIIDTEKGLLGVSLVFHDHLETSSFAEHHARLDQFDSMNTVALGLAHEIKNPLSGIKGASQLLASELKGNAELEEYAQIIQKEVSRVDHLLKEFLSVSKPQKPQRIDKTQVNINRILHDLVQLQKTVDSQNIKFGEEYDPSLPSITGELEGLTQVFLNLVTNAREAIQNKGQITLKSRMATDLKLMRQGKKRSVLVVEIQDDGEGMSEEDASQIFVPFFTTKAKGSGLGLALCQKIIEEHDGRIQVKSKLGMGTTFLVYLPI